MKKKAILFALLAALSLPSVAQTLADGDIYISSLYTTHIIFGSEITYANLSSQESVSAKIIEQSKNKLAIKARQPFAGSISLSVEEASGQFHTFIVRNAENPDYLIIDRRSGARAADLAKVDTIDLTQHYTTHFIFGTDIVYTDVSAPKQVAAMVVDQGKNKLALKARSALGSQTSSIAVEEANGMFHTYIIRYKEYPDKLVYNLKQLSEASMGSPAANSGSLITDSHESSANLAARTASKDTAAPARRGIRSRMQERRNADDALFRRSNAPLLSEIVEMAPTLYHIYDRSYKVSLSVNNIYSYSDITYITLAIRNASSVSYVAGDAVFVIESANGGKRKVFYETSLVPKNRYGSLSAAPGGESRIAYSFEKMTLSKEQVLKIYLYEEGGQRNLVLTLSAGDINGALSPR